MEKTLFKLKYEVAEENIKKYPVIVVAAGSSSRMNGIDKQLVEINGKPVIVRTLEAFENSPFISRIILVAKEENIPVIQRITDEYSLEKLTDIISGGGCRHESVKNGLERLTAEETKVLIHDGARPLVSDVVIENVASALESEKAVICAVQICDTVKRADENGFVSETVDRSRLYAVQTPQGISVPEYIEASAAENASVFTDDAALMEAAGYKVKIVEGDPENIKITTQKDIKLASLYLEDRI